MTLSEDDKVAGVNGDTDKAQDGENGRDRSGEAIPPKGSASNEQYTRHIHKRTEQQYRTGLRAIDGHASWRDVYRACHVGVGVDD